MSSGNRGGFILKSDRIYREETKLEENPTMEAALKLLALGYVPIPMKENGKKPLILWKDFQHKRPSVKQIVTWWTRWPNANLGIVTGKLSGITVIDVDTGHAPWPPKDCELPGGLVVRTPRAGTHHYFKYISGVGSNQGVLAKGIDVRGDGGCIVVPPSIVNGKPYVVETGSFEEARETIAPEWLQKALESSRQAKKTFTLPAVIPEGTRNSTLMRHAGSLLARGATEEIMLVALGKVNQERCTPPLPDEEIEEIARYVGQKEPSNVWRGMPPGSEASGSVPSGEQVDFDSIFPDGKFCPLALVKALEARNTFCFGFDEDRGAGCLMVYEGGVWRTATNVEIDAHRMLGVRTRQSHVRETVGALSLDVPHRPWPLWNAERLLINCQSGMLDPRTLELKEHAPEHFSTFQIPVRWNPDAAGNRVDSFLHEVLPAGEVQTVLEIIGYVASCDISAKKFFILEGKGDTGKTVVLSLIQNFIGLRNIAFCSLQDIADNRFASANIENKQLVIYDDLGEKGLENTSNIKVLTGGLPTMRVERKGVDAYFTPVYARFLFTCNAMPPSYTDHTGAWYNRPLIIPFKNEFKGNRADKSLMKTLARQECLERLFVLGAKALGDLIGRNMQFSMTTNMTEAGGEYRRRADSVAAFVSESCLLLPEASVNKVAWHDDYTRWCERAGYKPVGRNKAYERLLSVEGVTDDKISGAERIFRGIGLKHSVGGECVS
jgi:P4 family phage/plasmid primase-like protien